MSTYITRCTLAVNGKNIEDFKSITEKSRTIRKAVPLMHKTGSAQLTQRYTGDLEYVYPKDTTPFDFDGITGATLTIEYESGEQVRFGGVAVVSVGDSKVDGETELVKSIEFMAETRNGNKGSDY